MSKICKNCGIQYDGQACPSCGSTEVFPGAVQPQQQQPKKKHGCLMAILITIGVLFVFAIIGAALNSKDDKDTNTTGSNVSTQNSDKAEKPTDIPIEYTKYDVSELMNDLDNNAMKAEKKYTDQYVEITGRLSNIDSDGKYIDLMPTDNEFSFIGVQCYIKSDDIANKVMELEKDQTVTLKGKITEVGEVIGYSLNIEGIE